MSVLGHKRPSEQDAATSDERPSVDITALKLRSAKCHWLMSRLLVRSRVLCHGYTSKVQKLDYCGRSLLVAGILLGCSTPFGSGPFAPEG
jgi:hypothetical protein